MPRCEVFGVGPVIVMRWTPRLGNAHGELPKRWPRRWTFALADDWWKPWTWQFHRPAAPLR